MAVTVTSFALDPLTLVLLAVRDGLVVGDGLGVMGSCFFTVRVGLDRRVILSGGGSGDSSFSFFFADTAGIELRLDEVEAVLDLELEEVACTAGDAAGLWIVGDGL